MKPLFSLLVPLSVLQVCWGKCYYPNGNEAKDNIPCDPDAEVSACCGVADINGHACLTNTLCLGGNGKIIRGTCTDKSWNSPDCPQWCMGQWAGLGHDLVSCSNATGRDTSYCCDEMPGCCDSGIGRLEILPSHATTWALWDSSSSRYVVKTARPATVTTSSSTTTSSSSTSSISSSTTSTTTSATPGGTSASSVPQASQTSSSNSQPSQASADSSGGLSKGAQAGIGVGVAVGVLLLAAVFYLWRKLHKVTQLQQQQQQPQQQQYPQVAQELPPTMVYYPQDYRMKNELPADREAHELQGYSFPAGTEDEMDYHRAHSPSTVVAYSPQ